MTQPTSKIKLIIIVINHDNNANITYAVKDNGNMIMIDHITKKDLKEEGVQVKYVYLSDL